MECKLGWYHGLRPLRRRPLFYFQEDFAMLDTLNGIKQRFEERLQKLKDINDLEELRVAFTGKKVS